MRAADVKYMRQQPVQDCRRIFGGFYDFVNEPRKGFRNGPREFGIGVARGFGGLISGIFGGHHRYTKIRPPHRQIE